MNRLDFAVAAAWHDEKQRDQFLKAWGVSGEPDWLFLQRDVARDGCAVTKNKAIRRAVAAGAQVVVVLDDDCFPVDPGQTLPEFAALHAAALEPQPVRMFEVITDPPSRGTPYTELDLVMPIAASMGFWTEVGDYCAPRQLAFGATHPMTFSRRPVFGRFFPLCGMNYAFRPDGWDPWYHVVEGVGRFDDIWMGWMWQREAYRRGAAFNLNGPLVRHARQSNVWSSLIAEAGALRENETLWRAIATSSASSYDDLRALLPTPKPA